MQCPDCGRKYNDPEMRFCLDCIIPLVSAPAPPPPSDTTQHNLTGEQEAAASEKGFLYCPDCKKYSDHPDKRFCETCFKPLVATIASSPPPAAKVHRLTEEPRTTSAAEQKPPPVIVEVREEKKRRLNPLWLLLILLLLLTCCCGLLLTEQVEVPEFAAPYVAPFLEDMREAFRGMIGDPKPDGGGKGGDRGEDDVPVIYCEDLDRIKDEIHANCGGVDCYVWIGFKKHTQLDYLEEILENLYVENKITGKKEKTECTKHEEVDQYFCNYSIDILGDFNGSDEDDVLDILIENIDCVEKVDQCGDLDIDCDDFQEKVYANNPYLYTSGPDDKRIDHFGEFDKLGIKCLEKVEIVHQMSDSRKRVGDAPLIEAVCEVDQDRLHCESIMGDPDLFYCSYFKVGDCYALWSLNSDMILDECELRQVQKSSLVEPPSDCCPELEVKYTGYYNPTVLRLLEIDLTCENGAWNIDEGESVDGEVFVGEEQDIPWTEVGCKLSGDELHCESPDTVDQKKSWSKLEMVGDTCSSEVFFQSPYYAPQEESSESECPPGQIMCGGCCDPDDCYEGSCSP